MKNTLQRRRWEDKGMNEIREVDKAKSVRMKKTERRSGQLLVLKTLKAWLPLQSFPSFICFIIIISFFFLFFPAATVHRVYCHFKATFSSFISPLLNSVNSLCLFLYSKRLQFINPNLTGSDHSMDIPVGYKWTVIS